MVRFVMLLLLCLTIWVQALPQVVYIYQDEGVSAEAYVQTAHAFSALLGPEGVIRSLSAEALIQGDWQQDARLLIMPGGADLPYVKKLNGHGNDSIKRYVAQGGRFLGICAGAYYASAAVEFDRGGQLQVMGPRELAFFPGKAIGPVLAPYDYTSYRGSRAARIHTSFTEVPQATVYYHGGGYFADAESLGVQVLARYDNQLPAIVAMPYGQGQVVLSGVHVEYSPELLPDDDQLLAIRQSLRASSSQRRALLLAILKIIGPTR